MGHKESDRTVEVIIIVVTQAVRKKVKFLVLCTSQDVLGFMDGPGRHVVCDVYGVCAHVLCMGIHLYSFLSIFFHYRLLQDIEYSSLYYTVNPCCISIAYTDCVSVNPIL